MSDSADRNLLFGILALHMDFIDREHLVAAMHTWVGYSFRIWLLERNNSSATHRKEACLCASHPRFAVCIDLK